MGVEGPGFMSQPGFVVEPAASRKIGLHRPAKRSAGQEIGLPRGRLAKRYFFQEICFVHPTNFEPSVVIPGRAEGENPG
ncbi:hypothetical protein [Methylobacterium currus]|uniref:hypothetical protein n=1 Tax=Methylobacterium currus TaxID=2051553 RepID=UPI000F513441|nr:hypothetical protein [Methylobacterium currus]